jgi:predicted hotdog family 3-hydroxylacyl-ACP dehydratase
VKIAVYANLYNPLAPTVALKSANPERIDKCSQTRVFKLTIQNGTLNTARIVVQKDSQNVMTPADDLAGEKTRL